MLQLVLSAESFRPPFSKGGAGVGRGAPRPYSALFFLLAFSFAPLLAKEKAANNYCLYIGRFVNRPYYDLNQSTALKFLKEVRGRGGEGKTFSKKFYTFPRIFNTTYISKFSANFAFCSMNSRLGSTESPIRSENIASHAIASSTVTLRSVRFSGSIVVSQS